jgi:hypothetical protein
MKKLGKIAVLILVSMLLCVQGYAISDSDMPDNTHLALLQSFGTHSSGYRSYTLLDYNTYKKNLVYSRKRIRQILNTLEPYRNTDANLLVAAISQQLADIPYLHAGAMGEGDWQPTSPVYQPGAEHVNQNPVYRLDGLNCQTFVQISMALLHSRNIAQFDRNILKIAYGAAGNPGGEIVRYYNRNNFTDADFNPVNQRNGWMTDVTSQGPLAVYAERMTARVTRQKWFEYQKKNLAENVQVLAQPNGRAMVHRFMTVYSNLNFPKFDSEDISISYLPKEKIARKQHDGSFQPNQELLDKIPTPAVAEIVRDPGKWNYFRIKIKDIIGTELTISHLGLLYRQIFGYGELIYHKTTCDFNDKNEKVCHVTPVLCQKRQCNELMFAHATDSLPAGYFWYQERNGHYVCSPKQPRGVRYTSCNRVVALPFFDYLTDYQLGYYSSMDLHSVAGVHIEKL